jgi:Kef-type K+ transport system membrane component KefB
MSGSDFGPMLSVAFYLFLLYFFGKLFQFLSVPVILAEIAVGIVLGPKLLDAVPYASDGTCSEFPSSCNLATWNGDRQVSIWQFIGNIGVTLMIMESGMHINFKEVRNVGGQALAVAIVGTLLPVGLGILFVGFLCDGAYYPDGFAAGVALAPTSVGIAIQMLTENKMLSSTPGQTILTAAFIDDILSLVLLVIMLTLASGDPQAHTIVLPLVDAFAFVGMGVGLANYVFIYLKPLLDRHIKDYPKFSFQPRDEIHLMLMLACLVLFGWIGSLIGSHLLGAFVAGVCFVNVPRSHLVWKRQLKRIIKWCMRIFFGASVAFSIPVIEMISPDAIWKGAVVGLVPCILAKILAGCMYRPTQPGTKIYSKGEVVARRPKNKKKYKKIPKHICCSRLGDGLSRVMSIESMMVGFAMVGRGEFAYLVAEISKSTTYGASRKKMLSESIYAVVLWALIWSTIFAPIAFKWALQIYSSGKVMVRSQSIGGMSKKYSNQPFKIRLVSEHHVGILYEVLGVLHDSGLDVLEATAESDEVHDVDVFLVQPRSGTANFDDDKLEEISHHLKDAMGDKSGNARIVFEPAEIESDYKNDCMLEIELIGDHHPDLLHEILDWLALPENNLNVMKAFAETRTQHVDGHSLQIDIDKFFASPTNGIPITR